MLPVFHQITTATLIQVQPLFSIMVRVQIYCWLETSFVLDNRSPCPALISQPLFHESNRLIAFASWSYVHRPVITDVTSLPRDIPLGAVLILASILLGAHIHIRMPGCPPFNLA